MAVLNNLGKYFKLNPGSAGEPDMYLGAKLRQITLINNVGAWGMIPLKCVREADKIFAKHVKDNFLGNYTLSARSENLFFMGHEAFMDTYKALNPAEEYYFQSIIGVMRWMIEIGRIDIATEVSLL